ncbi:MAG TPA: toxin-antitoxin system HicB family antitoxin [Polyangia bacterium]
MATMTIRLPDEKHHRLRLLAQRNGVSLNKLVDEWASMTLAQFDAETRFLARAARGSPKRGLALLDKLDQGLAPSASRRRTGKKRGNKT